jgi:threonine 3-dehydrogenase
MGVTEDRVEKEKPPRTKRVMKGLQKTRPEPGAVEIELAPVPEPGPNEVVVGVIAAGICGTDVHIYDWDQSISGMMTPPVIFGHEFCGQVMETGSKVPRERLKPGDFVSAEMHVTCGYCKECRTGKGHVCSKTRIYGIHENGCFAEYVKVPASNVVRLPETLDPRIGAFLDALGNAVHTAFATDLTGKHVAVLGYGSIGAMSAAVAHFAGAASVSVTEIDPFNLEKARAWRDSLQGKGSGTPVHVLDVSGGAAEAIKEIRERTDGGVDAILEMSGSARAINDGLEMLRPGGEMQLLGLSPKDALTLEHYDRDLVFKGVTLRGIIGRRMFDTWIKMLDLLQGGLDVTHVVTHEFALEDYQKAFDTIHEGKALKVILYPDPNRRALEK